MPTVLHHDPLSTPGSRFDASASKSARSLGVLVALLLVTFAAAALGAYFTGDPSVGWYPTLAKPSFQPPTWIFAPVWTFLYASMGVAAWLVWRRAGFVQAHVWYGVQLALNVAWSGLFFGLHALPHAALEILLLFLAVLGTTVHFYRVSRPAAVLVAPYLAWVTFATLLTFEIGRLNAWIVAR